MARLPKTKKIEQNDDSMEDNIYDADSSESGENTSNDLETLMAHVEDSVPDSTEMSDAELNDSGEDSDFGIQISNPEPVKTKVTNVRVSTVCDHSCYIGGVYYHFKRGVQTYVPVPVKQILKNAGLLEAL